MPSIPGESASRSLESHHQSVTIVCKAITKAGVAVSDKDIEDCHRVGKRGTTIVKFCKRKVSKQVSNVRKDLTKLSIEDLQLTGQGKLYINQSLPLL